MTSSKQTKRALTASILSVVLCAAMLVGSTFAWFTDSVTSGNNTIVAGNLDVELEYRDREGKWQTVTEDTELFEKDALWEPGHTEVVYLKVKNAGDLALKYQLSVTAANETAFNNALGETDCHLSDYLVFGRVESNEEIAGFAKREDAWAVAGDKLGIFDYTKEEVLYPKEGAEGPFEQYIALVVYMPTEVGNEANYRGDAAPSIDLGVNLVAKQTPHEDDDFGNDYDMGAGYPVRANVSDKQSLQDALNHPGVPVEITLTETISSSDNLNIIGDVTLNLGDRALNKNGSEIIGATLTVENGGSLIINAESRAGFQYTAGKLETDGIGSSLTVNGGEYGISSANRANVEARNGSEIFLNFGSFSASGYQGHAVTAESGAVIYINGGSYSASGADSAAVYANGGTVVIADLDAISANGKRYDVDNGGKIILSKKVSEKRPTSLGDGCVVTEDGENWVITKE